MANYQQIVMSLRELDANMIYFKEDYRLGK